MYRSLLSLLLLAPVACGGGSAGARAGAGAPTAAKTTTSVAAPSANWEVSWYMSEMQRAVDTDPPKQLLKVQRTDSTGARELYVVGEFTGTCDLEPDLSNDKGRHRPILACRCDHQGDGLLLKMVRHGGHLVVLRAWLDDTEDDDSLSYDEITRIAIPVGAGVSAAPPVVAPSEN